MVETSPTMAPANDVSRPSLLLVSKLYIPRAGYNLVARPRLTERMRERVKRKLTLVSAPAGFGKTTLLSEWAAGCARPVAWISLDEGDNDPARFWTYFIAALETLQVGLGENALALLHSSPPLPIEAVLTALINAVTASPNDFVLVLDDYHVIESQPVHDAVAFLLDHLPGNMHLVIATRADPPLPIARLRGRGQLTELRQADLRFTPDEVAEFLERVMGLELSADDVAALAARTEGWIAGLQMAALSIQGREDVHSFIATFTGSQHYILDYLIEEVLQRQPESVQTFLLQTSILDRMTGPLCDAVLEMGDRKLEVGGLRLEAADLHPPISHRQSHLVLEQLEHANLFVVPLDDRQEWYRYHHLFADLLRHRLGEVYPGLEPSLHRRASEWYERNGHMAEAIDHALSAGDWERAVCLIEQAAEAALMRSEVTTFLSWAEALPDEMVHARPLLCVYHAVALILSGRRLSDVQAHLQDAMKADTAGSASGAIAAFGGLLAAYRGDTRQCTELSQRALALLPETSLFLRSLVAGYLALNALHSGDVEAATRALEQAARISRKAGNLMNTVLAVCHLAELSMIQGQLHRAKAYYDEALELAVDRQGRPVPIAGMALMGLGELLREWNDLEGAARHITQGIELTRQWGEVGAISGYVTLARIRQAQGDAQGACEAIQTAQQIARKFDAMQLNDISVAARQAELWLMQGNLAAARRWVEERGLEGRGSQVPSPLYRTFEQIVLARFYLTQTQPARALAVLEPLLQTATTSGWQGIALHILVLRGLALWQTSARGQGQTAAALTVLQQALSVAESQGYVRLFVDAGAPMAELLRQAASQGIAPDYVGKLLAAFGDEAKDEGRTMKGAISSSVLRPSSLVEPLSERELEVLRLLAADLSSTAIAQELVVSVNTVRSHIKSIYSKLSAHSRYEAVARARELNLLQPKCSSPDSTSRTES